MTFYKFDGAGNDFVLIDARKSDPCLTPEQIAHICHRRFGVGADGLMTLHEGKDEYDFEMRYYNSDGYPASMCGNGGRCIVIFAHMMGVGDGKKELFFRAADGPHHAQILVWDGVKGVVRLGMRDVPATDVRQVLGGTLLDTGVPHFVQRVMDLDHFDVVGEGRRLRNSPEMGPEGANVNFIKEEPDGVLRVRTYERGVEDETWACGTGVTACAIVTGCHKIDARGGSFEVDYERQSDAYTKVFLTGPVSCNFIGEIDMA